VALLYVQANAEDPLIMCSVISMLASDGLSQPEPKEPAYISMSFSTMHAKLGVEQPLRRAFFSHHG
jgi:hypothetical protein